MNYRTTIRSSFIGYVVQAIINNFVPMMFLTFQNTYGISLEKITMLAAINFMVQLFVDLLSVRLIDKIGYRISIVAAHAFSAAGLIMLTVLPEMLADAFAGILISVIVYAVGGGLIEVLISPIVESCPTDNKEKAMSLLHSFYCWGHVAVVLISTLFFKLAGLENWKILSRLWALIPIINGIIFVKTPIAALIADDKKGMSLKELFCSGAFWLLILMMICSGASEQAVSQWVSVFAEKGLGVNKLIGDLAGPMTFAVCMGSSRAFYGNFGDKINLNRFMLLSSALCVFSYIMIGLSKSSLISLAGCAVCGLSVGIMWPGTFSNAAAKLKNGGTSLFALLALAGDVGCSGGPALVGVVSGMFNDNLKIGMTAAIIFPFFMTVFLLKEYMRKI